MQEIWLPVINYVGIYEVSNLGRVRSVMRTIQYPKNRRAGAFTKILHGQILTPSRSKTGYQYLSLRDRKRESRKMFVHRLVAMAFIPNPSGLPQVNHKDLIKSNNAASNLEWCTALGNMAHSFESGARNVAKGSQCGMSVLTERQVLEIRELLDQGIFQYRIAPMFGVCQSTISKIKTGLIWRHA